MYFIKVTRGSGSNAAHIPINIRNINEYVIINIINILDCYLNIEYNNFLLCIIKSFQIRQKPD